MTTTIAPSAMAIDMNTLLEHWQGHRRLTRRVIEAFPEDKLFTHAVAGMRPFGEMAHEILGMIPGMEGVISGQWPNIQDALNTRPAATTKAELLERWDAATEELDRLWAQVPEGRLYQQDVAFGQWEGPVYFFILYWIDNEIHHRGQGYVYLRSLGITPPGFWERQ